VFLFVVSFYGKAPADALHWLFTPRGRLGLLVAGLLIGFWPQLYSWLQDRIVGLLTGTRPVTNRRLRKETHSLVADIHRYVRENPRYEPSFWSAAGHADWFALQEEYEKRSQEERNALAERFGGRVAFVLSEFDKRGMLSDDMSSDSSKSLLLWKAQSLHWIIDLAGVLSGLALQLDHSRRFIPIRKRAG